ncbi:MAG: cyclic nucleotide-binding protein [Bacteroidetes bacterium]|nr:cyclic nucleotide-binding protein [Bacteroidota bacterium]
MELSLRHIEQSNFLINGAFIRGTDPAEWLRELDRYEVSYEHISCYVVPKGLDSVSPAGLFVMFHEKPKCRRETVKFPYRCVGEKLFIPLHSTLFPETSTDELKQLILFDVMVFHPSIGLIGYEQQDRKTVDDLITLEPPMETRCLDVPDVKPVFLPLNRIHVEEPPPEQLIESLKEDVGTKSIDDLKEKERSGLEKLKDDISLAGLKGLKNLTEGIGKLGAGSKAGSGGAGGDSGGGSGKEEEGLMDKFSKWMDNKIEDLEKKRESELKRLLDMFDKNSDEALQYAIPLGSNYFNRGEAPPSAKLTRNDTSFNLGKLGGGDKVDGWDLSKFYNDLRTKYIKAAQTEIENENYKKAAYIYAHLLNDFHSAADVLKRGKMYREAATVYKDHLNNKGAAAECLESGGLYNEAIDLYIELNRNEKVGDLYVLLERSDNANIYYEKCVENALTAQDYIEAARLQEEKKKEHERATATLLEGWENSSNREACLTKYFDKLQKDEADLVAHINNVYNNKTPSSKRSSFLNVLAGIADKKENEEMRAATKEMAYSLVGEQVMKGNSSALYKLKSFVPDDRFLPSDFNRYLSSAKEITKYNQPVSEIKLPEGTNWIKVINIRDEFLAFGYKGRQICFARGNWNGYVEHSAMTDELFYLQDVVTDTFFTHRVFVCSKRNTSHAKKLFDVTREFSHHIIVEFPNWIPESSMGAVITGRDRITFLCRDDRTVSLHNYSFSGSLINIVDCRFSSETASEFVFSSIELELLYRREFIFFKCADLLFRIDETGLVQDFYAGAVINKLELQDHHAALRFMASTEFGCLLYRADSQDIKANSHYFGEGGQKLVMIKHIPDNKFLTVELRKITVFDIQNDQPEPICVVETDVDIIDVLRVKRNSFATLSNQGKLFIHEITS